MITRAGRQEQPCYASAHGGAEWGTQHAPLGQKRPSTQTLGEVPNTTFTFSVTRSICRTNQTVYEVVKHIKRASPTCSVSL